MTKLYYDGKTGNPQKGQIWAFSSVNKFAKMGDFPMMVYGEYVNDGKIDDEKACPLDKSHVTGIITKKITIDLFSSYGGANLGNWIPLSNHGLNIVSEKFVSALKKSGLNGWKVNDVVKVRENQSSIDKPQLFEFDVTGKAGISKRFHVEGCRNLCPFCGKQPIFCYGCGNIINPCIDCGKRILAYSEKEAKKNRQVFFSGFPAALVVSKKDWDGSDLFSVSGSAGNWFVNQKAKMWLEAYDPIEVFFEDAYLAD